MQTKFFCFIFSFLVITLEVCPSIVVDNTCSMNFIQRQTCEFQSCITDTTLSKIFQKTTCISLCCKSDISLPTNGKTYQDICAPIISNSNSTIFAVLVPGGVMLIIILTICICGKNCLLHQLCINSCFKQFQRSPSSRIIHNTPFLSDSLRCLEEGDSDNIRLKLENPVNVAVQGNMICSICLQDRIDVILPCKHNIHKQCLIQWLLRKQNCPECRNDHLQKFIVFCEGCLLKAGEYKKINKKARYLCEDCYEIKDSDTK